MRAVLLCLSLVVLAACDTEADGPVSFQGVTVEARGDASLALDGGALVVSGLDGTRSGGFTVPGASERVDVEIDPLAVPAGGEFGVVVEDDEGGVLASLYTVGRGQGAIEFVFEFPSALGVGAVAVTYRRGGENGEVVLEGVLELAGGRLALGRRPSGSVGEGGGDTGSTHVIRENGRYVVVSDSDDASPARPGARRGCGAFTVTPPPAINDDGVTVCSDWIEVEPLLSGTVPEGTVSVTARGVGAFTVRKLAAR